MALQVHVSAAAVVPSLSGAVRTAAERTVLLTFAPRMAVVSLSGYAPFGRVRLVGDTSALLRFCFAELSQTGGANLKAAMRFTADTSCSDRPCTSETAC